MLQIESVAQHRQQTDLGIHVPHSVGGEDCFSDKADGLSSIAIEKGNGAMALPAHCLSPKLLAISSASVYARLADAEFHVEIGVAFCGRHQSRKCKKIEDLAFLARDINMK